MTPSVEREVLLPAPVEEVWEAVSGPEELEAWLADDVELELEEGGALEVSWEDGTRRSGTIERVEAPERLSWRWAEDGDGEATLVEIALEPVEEGTLVRVVEHAPPAGPMARRLPPLSAHVAALAIA